MVGDDGVGAGAADRREHLEHGRPLVERTAVLEALTGIRRAGADIIITYHAKEAARWLQ